MTNVINMKTSAADVLEAAKTELKDCLVIGWTDDDVLVVSSTPYFANVSNTLYALANVQHRLLSGDYETK